MVQGPFGGGAVSVRGPFGGGAVSVRGPFGGRVSFIQPPAVAVAPPVIGVVPPVVSVAPSVFGVSTSFGGIAPVAPVNWPYSAAFLARIPPGFPTLMLGTSPYYYTLALPPGSQPALVGNVNFFVSGGIFFQPYFYGGQTVYVIVER
jgi:hypothetical protein